MDWWKAIPALSMEEREKLMAARPSTVGDLWAIPGITPAAVMAIWTNVRKAGQTRRVSAEVHRERSAQKQQEAMAQGGKTDAKVEM